MEVHLVKNKISESKEINIVNIYRKSDNKLIASIEAVGDLILEDGYYFEVDENVKV